MGVSFSCVGGGKGDGKTGMLVEFHIVLVCPTGERGFNFNFHFFYFNLVACVLQ